ncbi:MULTISPECIES: c-type cytochrome [unclassified Marinovum]
MRLPLTFGLVLGVFATAAFAQDAEPFAEGAYSDYSADAENGKTIYYAAGCATCHGVDGDDTLLAGGQSMATKFGDLYTPNITHHNADGIGEWSNATFLNAVLRGLTPEGESYFGAVFPYPAYSLMKPEDALDMKAYMATLPLSDAKSRDHNVSLVSQTVLKYWNRYREPLPTLADAQMARGQYLVEAVGHCGECHTPRGGTLGEKPDTARAYQGEFGLLGEYAPDISASRLANVEPVAFVVGALTEATKLNGNPMTSPSMRRIARQTQNLGVEDRTAIFAYLSGKSVDVSTLPQVETVAAGSGETGGETGSDSGGGFTPIIEDTPIILAEADTRTAPSEPRQQVVPDFTEADRLVKRVDAYCQSTEPVMAEVPPARAAAPVAAPKIATAPAKAGIDPALVSAADQLIEDYCRACHAPGKSFFSVFPTGDIADMKFDKRILTPGDPEASPLYSSIAKGTMPKGLKMNSDQLGVLRDWINALAEPDAPVDAPVVAESTPAPAAPAPAPVAQAPREELPAPLFAGFSRQQRMLAIANDIASVDERDRQYVRYFTFSEMPLAKIDCNDAGAMRNPMHYLHAGFNKLINSLSNGPRIVTVTPVPNTEGAVVRIDLRDYDWSFDDWLTLSTGVFTQEAADADFGRDAWEDLAVVYPYGIDPQYDPLLQTVSDATGAYVPIMRADWVSRFASQSPYYDVLLNLTGDIRDMEERLGIDVDREIEGLRMIRAGMLPGSSGVSDHNRMLERFDLPRGGYYWKSYDFAGDSGEQSLELHPDGPRELPYVPSQTAPFEHDGGEMIFSLRNGMQGYYLSTNLGERLLVGPASIVSFRTKPIGKGVEIVNARSCFDCHDNGMIEKKDEMRDAMLSSQRFSRDELEVLLEMYVENDELSEYYSKDRATFLSAMRQMNATDMTAGGEVASLRAPMSAGGAELVTYMADTHFHALEMPQLARDFYLDEDEFRTRARRMGDPTLTFIVGDWISRLDAGGKIQRSEVEKYYGDILERITDLRAYRAKGSSYEAVKHEPVYVAPEVYEEKVEKAVEVYVAKEEVYEPAVKEPVDYAPPSYEPDHDKLTLAIHVDRNQYYVNDLLEFEIEVNKRCELQVFYVEESKNIEEMPPQLLGPTFMEAGERRKIPYDGSDLQIRFDTPGSGETMLAFCRSGGLGDKKMSAEGAKDYAKSHFQPLTRGISIESAKIVAEDDGQSATNHVTFDVYK